MQEIKALSRPSCVARGRIHFLLSRYKSMQEALQKSFPALSGQADATLQLRAHKLRSRCQIEFSRPPEPTHTLCTAFAGQSQGAGFGRGVWELLGRI
eukprot:1435932-Rhodomonas_salina.1